MNFYSYDRITGEYLGSGVADPNPKRPGEYLIPAFATTVPPMVPSEGHKAVWQSGVWTELPAEFVEPGEEPLTLEQMKAKKREIINIERDGILHGGFWFPKFSVMVDSDPQSAANIMLAAQLALLPGAPESVEWRMQDNTTRTLTAADVIEMAALLGQHIQATYAASWARKAALEAAQDPEEISAV